MAIDILMPQLGETVAEGKITVWHKTVGEPVTHGDSLFEVESDKASMEVPAIASGILTRINVNAGESAAVGVVVAVLDGEAQEHSKSSGASAHPSASAQVPDPFDAVRTPERNFGPARLPNGVRTSPRARRLASLGGIDLSRIEGAGPGGRITAQDVSRAAASRAPASSALSATALPAAAASTTSVPARPGASSESLRSVYTGLPQEQLPIDMMRRTIARRLTEAKQSVPHFYLSAEIDIDQLSQLRSQFNALGIDRVKASLTDLIVKAYALALQRVPEANVVWAEDCILKFSRVDLGVAVSVPGGLFTPIVRGAESKPLAAIAAEIRSFAQRAKGGQLKPSDYQGGCATISNLGMYGVREFAAIVNPPQSTILAVGAAERRACEAAGGGIAFKTMMTVTLSCDHRVVDGVTGAKLLQELKAHLQSPLRLLL